MGTGSNMMGLADHCRVTRLLDLIGRSSELGSQDLVIMSYLLEKAAIITSTV